MMQKHKLSQGSRAVRQGPVQVQSSGVSFAQPGQPGQTSQQCDMLKDKYFNCGSVGHHAKDCTGGSNAGAEKSLTDFFNVEDEAAALEEELGNLGMGEGTDFFNMLEGVGFLEVEQQARRSCDRNKRTLTCAAPTISVLCGSN